MFRSDRHLDTDSAADARRRRASLLHHRDFMMVWSAATVSVIGSQVTLIALPFIALTMLHASVFEVSLLAAVEMVPFLLFTLPAGAWLDRVRRRPVLVGADIVRACVLLTIPCAYVAGVMSLPQLFVVAFVTGSATAFFDVADQSYLPAILERDELVEGNARLQISNSIAQISGPTLGGYLIALVAAPIAIAVDAVSFFLSGALLSGIRQTEKPCARHLDAGGRPVPMHREIREGLVYVLGNPLLRPIAACTGISNLFAAALFGVFPVLIWDRLHLSPAFYGTVMGLASVGFLVGAAVADRLPRWIGIGPTIVFSAALGAPAFLLMVLTPHDQSIAWITLGGGWFVAGFSQVIYNVGQISVRQAITPSEMQSRMNATMRFIVWGTIPLGFVMGGVLATALPVRTALVLAALACATSFFPVFFSPLRALKEIPAEWGVAAEAARPAEPVRTDGVPVDSGVGPGSEVALATVRAAAATAIALGAPRAERATSPERPRRPQRGVAALNIGQPTTVGRRTLD